MKKEILKFSMGALMGWIGAFAGVVTTSASIELAAPFPIQAGGKPIDVTAGHAAPWVMDFDGDGLKDLVVGQFDDCKLRIYRNVGTKTESKYNLFGWFRAGATEVKLPGG